MVTASRSVTVTATKAVPQWCRRSCPRTRNNQSSVVPVPRVAAVVPQVSLRRQAGGGRELVVVRRAEVVPQAVPAAAALGVPEEFLTFAKP